MAKKQGSLLIVDDNKDVLIALDLLLGEYFSKIEKLKKPDTLRSILEKETFDVIILDMNFKAGVNTGNEGIFWMNEILKSDPDAIIILITAYGDIELAVKAIKDGATDFITKPWDDEKLVTTILNAYKFKRSKLQVSKLNDKQKHLNEKLDSNYPPIIGKSKAIHEVLNKIDKVAPTNANVLILGENGTGKELIAREVYRKSDRSKEIFVNVDLSALPETLLESELFGYTKGAFTDAKQDKAGKFEVASDGTLFIDEIGNLSLSAQAKLLTVLQNREVTRLGSSKKIPVDFRLVTATNKDLHEMVENGEFREDLLYRINTITLELAPLRDRIDDIPLLLEYFLKEFNLKYKKDVKGFTKEAIDNCKEHVWHGNIRELYHTVEKAIILSEKEYVDADDFEFTRTRSSGKQIDTFNLEEHEESLIRKAIEKCEGNYTNAANLLGVSRKTLYNKAHKYGI